MLSKINQILVLLFTIIFSSFTFSQTTCNDTSWNKGVDFNGDNQHLKQVSQNTGVNAIRMVGQSQTVALGTNANLGYTTDVGAGRPWATTIMFKTDRNGSNQHIWNSGEGAGSTDDNIYLRLDANGWVYFGWGRGSSNNECRFLGIPSSATGRWFGVYIAHNGGRFNSSNATAANLADAFDIRVMTDSNGDNFTTLGANQSTSSNWISTGNRMDRSVTGDFTIGGRGSNRSFHGQVASMVVTTLKLNDPMPNDAEIKAMITDPMGWLNDYKIGNIYGHYNSGGNLTNFQLNTLDAAYATQVWLMGDGTSDSYSNGIRNQVHPTEQNYGKLQLNNNMQNSIQSVNISGFSEAACRATSAVFGTETTSTLNLESFTAPSGGADGYAIYINDSNSFTAPSNGDEPTADLSWNDSGQQPVYFGTSASPDITVTDLDPGTTYYFQVYAYNDSSGTETYETTGLNASDDTTADTSPPSVPTVGPASATTVTGTAEAGSTVTVTDSDGDVIGTATADSDGNYSVTLSSAQSNGSTLSVTATDASGNESEATTTRVVIGITYEGPSSNQTGTSITDNGKYGWISIDETLSAGQRFVMDNAFFTDFFDEMPNAYEIRIGLKGDNWDNGDQSTKTNSAITGEVFKGDLQLRISGSTQSKTFQLFKPGTNYNTMLVNTPASQDTTCAFIEITSDGNNIRMGFGKNGYQSVSQGDESTVVYSDWSAYKAETGDQGFGISSLDVVFLVTDIFNFNEDFDGANVDWTGLTEVSSDPTDGLAPIAPAVSTASGSTVIGTAEFGSTVTVTDSNGDVIGTATADSDGNYSVTLSPAQSDGSTLTVTATDASGNESEETTTYIPISGFTHIAASASMAGTDVLDDGSAVSIDDTLSDGQRIVFSADWIKTNVWDNIPSENVSGSGDAIYIGILKTGHNLNSISDDDFAFAYKFWNDSGTSDFKVVTTVKNGGAAINSTAVQGTWNRDVVFFHDYSVTGHFHGLYNAAAGTGATIAVPTVYSHYSTQPTSEDVTIVIASTGPQASISTTGISEVDASAPDAPIVSTASADTVTGTAEAGSTVTVSDSDGDVIGTATADSSGNYSVTLSPAQSDGSTLTVTATDATGNESGETTTTVDASAPDAPIVSTASADTVTGTAEAGSTVTVTDSDGDVIGTATTDSSGNYSVTLSPAQSDGSTLTVTATDATGNESGETTTTVDASAPDAPIVSTASADTVTGTAEAASTVTVTDSNGDVIGTATADSSGNYSVTLSSEQSNGSTLAVTATDATGNESGETTTTVDASAPDAPIVSTASADTVTGTAEAGSTVTVTDSNGDVIGTATADSSGNYSVTLSPAQSDGSTLTVTATDASGNESGETTTTVDASAPDAPIVSTASADTVTGTAEAASTVTVTDSNGDVIGTATADSSGNYSVTLSPEQSNGSTLAVTATDASGNESDQTTTTIVLGITLVGPSDNQTGTNLFDAGDHGWATLDESLSAGERLTLTNAFLSSLVDAMPDNSYIIIGLKSSTWSSTITDDDILDNNYNGFKGKAYLKIDKYDSSNSGIVRMSLGANGTNSSFVDVGSGGAINSGYNAFIEISADGNNIRLGQGLLTANGGDDPVTTPYCDWSDISSTNKAQTGDQDFGITSLDVLIGGGGNSSDSIKTHGGMNTAPVEWIIMSQVGVPSTPCSAPTSQATSAVFGSETSTSLNLESFTAPAGGAVGYAIYINDSNSFTAPLNGVEPTEDLSWNGSGQQPVYFGTSASPNITVTDLDPGTTYYFQVYAYNNSSGTEIYETTGLNASDDTAAQVVPGITLEGPNANQSGTNLSDVDDWGWASLNDPLGAGERVVFNNDFMLDIFSSMPDNYVVRIGLKDDSWDNSEGNGRDGFLGGTFLLIKRESVDYGSISLWANGLPSFTSVTLSSIISDTDKFSAFIELDALGDKINIGLNSTDFSDELNVYSTAYCNWAEDAKATTNNSVGYNISTVDIMIRGAATVDNLAGFDTADVDWLEITQVAVPSPAPTAQATSAVFGTETSTSLNLSSFTAPAGGADGYVIYVNDTNSFTAPTDGDEPTADLSWNGSGQQPVYFGTSVSPNITVTDLNPGTTYYYKVYAYKNCLESETYEAIGLNATDTTAIGVLTITGITGDNKVYDGTTAATATGTATLVGVASGDDVFLGGSPVFTFASANVGTGITINTTGLTISGTDSGNYSLSQPTLSGDITRRSITLTASNQEKNYGDVHDLGDTAFTTLDLDGDAILPNGEVVTNVTVNSATGVDSSTTSDVATYADEIEISGPVAGIDGTGDGFLESNYDITYVAGDLTVNRRAAQIIPSAQEKDYGDVHDLGDTAFTVVDRDGGALPNGETVDTVTLVSENGIDASTDANAVLYADNISVTPTSTNDPTITGSANFNQENYTFSYDTGDLTVNRRAAQIIPSVQEKDYGDVHDLGDTAFTVVDRDGGALPNGETVNTVTLVSENGIDASTDANVGTYADNISVTPTSTGDSTITGSGNFNQDNYTFSYDTGDLTINLANLTITGITGDNKVYDGTTDATASGTPVLSGVVSDDDVVLGGTPVFTFASAELGTDIQITTTGFIITGADSGNYTLIQPTFSGDITAKELTITGITGGNKVYDDTTAAIASGTATLLGVEAGDDVILRGSPVFTFASANVGTGITINTSGYTISGTDSGNYTLTQPTLSGDITAKELTITGITGDNKVYDDTTAASTSGTATLVGIEAGDDVFLGGSPVFTFASANVGTGITITTTGYTISGTDSGNYTLTQPTLSGDITAAPLTVTASDQTKVYGATDPTLTYSITGFQGTDTEADLDTGVSISRAAGEDVGTYTITPSAAADSNYTVSFVTADFTITAADLTVTASDQTKVYGATDPTLTYSITGFQGTDTEADLDTAVSISRAVGEDVGTYTITPSAAADSNYTVSFVTADFTITAADLTVTASDQTKVYGATDPTLTYSITGFQGTDTEADLDTAVSISRAVGEAVGTYTITPSAAADSNYTVSFVTADFTITAADLTVTASDQTKVYGATDPTLTYSITGFQGTDTEADLDTEVSISRAVGEDVGTYTITPSAAADSNYTVSFVTADFTITAADLTVTASDQTKVYGATDPTLTYSITGFQGTDTEADLDTAVSISRAVGEDVGTYTITPSAAADSNYTVSFVTADFAITVADLTVTAIDQTKVYGATDPSLSYTITGFVNGEDESDLDTAVSISRAVGEDVGTYTITPSAADSNYTISFVTADFTITQTTLTITGLVGKNKVYDETTVATSIGVAALAGVVSNDDVSLGGSPVFTFEVPDPGIFIMITTTGYTITGSDSGNYILIQPTLYADITDPDEDCDGDGIIDTEDTDFSSCALAIRNTTRYGFSPNEDGINDVWFIENIFAYPNNTVKVFNRSGKLVFKQRGYQNDWNGESNQVSSGRSGNKLPTGPYIFMLDLGEGNELIKGWLYINY